MIFVFDSTTLIYFAKLKILDKLSKISATRIIPQLVYKEVVIEGKRKGEQDAILIENLASRKIFNIKEAENKELFNHLFNVQSLDRGDAETLALAKELNGVAIIDDVLARTVTEIENIKFHGSIYLLFLLHKEKLISKEEIKINVDKMIKLGWRCSTEFYAAILEETEKL